LIGAIWYNCLMKNIVLTEKSRTVASQARNEVVVYQPDETIRLEAIYADESIWLTQLKLEKSYEGGVCGVALNMIQYIPHEFRN